MISQWNYQCTHQIPGKMGAYFIQFKVVRLNWLTAIENVVNLVNSSLILTPFFAKIYLRHVVRQSTRSVWSFLCMTVNQDTALSSTAHNYIYFFCFFWNGEMPCLFRPVVFERLPFATDYNFVSLAFTLTHEFYLFFFAYGTYLSGSIRKDSVSTCSCEKRSSFRSSHVMHSKDHALCILNRSTVLSVRTTYTQ